MRTRTIAIPVAVATVLVGSGAGIAAAASQPQNTAGDGVSPVSTENADEQNALPQHDTSLQDATTALRNAQDKLAYWKGEVARDAAAKNQADQALADAVHVADRARQTLADATAHYRQVRADGDKVSHAKNVAQDAYDKAKTASEAAAAKYTDAAKARGLANAANLSAQAELERLTDLRGRLANEVRGLQSGFDTASADIPYRQGLIALMQQKLPGWQQKLSDVQSQILSFTDDIELRKGYIKAFQEKYASWSATAQNLQNQIGALTGDIALRNGYISAFQQKLPVWQQKVEDAKDRIELEQKLYRQAKSAGDTDAMNAAHAAAEQARADRDAALAQVEHYGPAAQATQRNHIAGDNQQIATLRTQLTAAQEQMRHYGPDSQAVQQGHIDKDQAQIDALAPALKDARDHVEHYTRGQTYAQQHIAHDQKIIDHYNDVKAQFDRAALDQGVAAGKAKDAQRAYNAAETAFQQAKNAKVAADTVTKADLAALNHAIEALDVARQNNDEAKAAMDAAQRDLDGTNQSLSTAQQAASAAGQALDAANTKVAYWSAQVEMWTAVVSQAHARVEDVAPAGPADTAAVAFTGVGGTGVVSGRHAATKAVVVTPVSGPDRVNNASGAGAPVGLQELAETGVDNPLPLALSGAGLVALGVLTLAGRQLAQRRN